MLKCHPPISNSLFTPFSLSVSHRFFHHLCVCVCVILYFLAIFSLSLSLSLSLFVLSLTHSLCISLGNYSYFIHCLSSSLLPFSSIISFFLSVTHSISPYFAPLFVFSLSSLSQFQTQFFLQVQAITSLLQSSSFLF